MSLSEGEVMQAFRKSSQSWMSRRETYARFSEGCWRSLQHSACFRLLVKETVYNKEQSSVTGRPLNHHSIPRFPPLFQQKQEDDATITHIHVIALNYLTFDNGNIRG